jgi:uncharacterized protein DUF4926
MIAELELVVLRGPAREHGLRAGDVGTVVHAYTNDSAYEVEFVDGSGDTVAVLTLSASQVRRRGAREVLHARELAAHPR